MEKSDLEISFGVFDLSLAELRNKEGESEDGYFIDEEARFFALFDGLDGEKGSNDAVKYVLKVTEKMLAKYEAPATSSNLVWMMSRLDEALKEEGGIGGTSCILARVLEKNGEMRFIFAAMGDSRIYLRKNGQVSQITFDDVLKQKDLDAMKIFDPSEREKLLFKKVRKYLNSGEKFEVSYNNSGEVTLNKGDRILICSDGVSGENVDDKLTNENILEVFNREFDDNTSAKVFVKVARKEDDRTAIVISAR